ncbi:MAG: hypothetical protein ACRENO_08345, partial [Thermodesulfobacteriota bacterium]
TDNGSVATSKILKTSSNLIEGKISIEENNSTIVEVNSGELEAITSNKGISKIEEGQAVVLTRADYKVAQGNPEVKTAEETTSSVYKGSTLQLPPGLKEYLSFFGERGTAITKISKNGKITIIKDEYKYDRNAKAVDFALLDLEKELEIGTPVKIVCANFNKGEENSEYFVRETDNLYPQLITEKILLGKSIKTQTDAAPHGLSELEDDTTDETNSNSEIKKNPDITRSFDKWDTAIIDPETMQPDFNQRVSKGTELEVVCIRSTLVLQPVETASDKYINLVGKNAVAVTEITPFGKINVDGITFDAILTDLNLQPKKLEANMPEGTSYTVVGVKEVDGKIIVLVQEKDEVLEELLAVGEDVSLLEDSKEGWGVVKLSGNKWWGKIVGKDFLPIEKSFPANTIFKVTSIDTVLLANTSSILAAAWLPSTSIIPILLIGGAIIPPAIVVPIIDNNNDDDPLSEFTVIVQ